MTLFTKLNLWWKDATCRILTEEAARIGVSENDNQSAIDMVEASCNSSLVQMAKRYDAELEDLHGHCPIWRSMTR